MFRICYWIVGMTLLLAVASGYAIRITTIDYLNRYQNQGPLSGLSQSNTNPNTNTNINTNTNANANTNTNTNTNINTNTNTNSNSNSNTNSPQQTNQAIQNQNQISEGYASWNPNATSNTQPQSTPSQDINKTHQNITKSEPALFAYWVEGAAQNANSSTNSTDNDTNTTEETTQPETAGQSSGTYFYYPPNAPLYDQHPPQTSSSQGATPSTSNQAPSPPLPPQNPQNSYISPSTVPSYPYVPSNNPYDPATYYSTSDSEALKADYVNMAGGSQPIIDPNAGTDWSSYQQQGTVPIF